MFGDDGSSSNGGGGAWAGDVIDDTGGDVGVDNWDVRDDNDSSSKCCGTDCCHFWNYCCC